MKLFGFLDLRMSVKSMEESHYYMDCIVDSKKLPTVLERPLHDFIKLANRNVKFEKPFKTVHIVDCEWSFETCKL